MDHVGYSASGCWLIFYMWAYVAAMYWVLSS